MKVLLNILNSDKTNLGKLELVEQLEKNIKFNSNQLTSTPPIRLDLRKKIEILNLILNENEWNTYKLLFPDKLQLSFFEIVSQSNNELNWLGNSIFIFLKTGILFYILLLYIINLIFCITIKWPIQFLFMKRKKK